MKSGKKVSLIMQILIAMVLGVIVGVIWGKGASCIQFIGTVWLNIIKMFIVPVVICMVVRGVSSLDSPKALGRIGLRVVISILFSAAICTPPFPESVDITGFFDFFAFLLSKYGMSWCSLLTAQKSGLERTGRELRYNPFSREEW